MKSKIRVGGVLLASTAVLAGCAGEAPSPANDLSPEDFLAEEGPALGEAEQEFFGRHWWKRSKVRPRIQCVDDHGDGEFTAHWGYKNSGSSNRTIAVGHKNKFLWTDSNQGQPTEFEPGVHDDVFTTDFQMSKWSPGHVWLLDGKLAWANWFTERCEDTGPECESDADCSNGLACDGAEACVNDECVAGTPVVCDAGDECSAAASCEEQNGAAVCVEGDDVVCEVQGDPECNSAGSCDPVNGCGADVPDNEGGSCGVGGVCQSGDCVVVPCDDGVFCNGVEVADPNNPGSCLPGVPVVCGDGLACNGVEVCSESANSCVAGTPIFCPGDGNVCNGGESCSEAGGGTCVSSGPLNCPSTDQCNVGICDASSGCDTTPVANGTACAVGSDAGQCQAGQCQVFACVSDAQCDDGNACNGDEACVGNSCVAGTPLTCDNGLFCDGAESCNPAVGCVAGTAPACDNGLFCDGTETCNEAIDQCVSGSAPVCDDGNACNGDEVCNEAINGCSDGTALVCNDGSACTSDSCNPAVGCVNEDVSDSCGIADECLVGSCVDATGCVINPVADGTACDANGEVGQCSAGVCEGGGGGDLCADGSTPVQMVIPHSFRGAYNSPGLLAAAGGGGAWKVLSGSYQVRSVDTFVSIETTRGYHSFDLSGVAEVLEAELRIAHPATSFDSPDADGTEVIEVRSTSLSSAQLEIVGAGEDGLEPPHNLDISVLQNISDNLGNGQILASFAATEASNGTTEVISLNNAAALADLSGSANFWTAAMTLQEPLDSIGVVERVFRGSGDSAAATELSILACVGSGGGGGDPVSAPFVDTGHFMRAFVPSTEQTIQSFHFGPTPISQSYLSKKEPFSVAQVVRRPYFAFDLAGISTVSQATLRLWVSGPHASNNNTGSYDSPDASETFELHAMTTPALDVINAPFGDIAEHALDVPIWEDLGDGAVIGSRVYTEANTETGLIVNPNDDDTLDCSDGAPLPADPADAPACGKFIEITLDPGAVAASANGLFIMGGSVPTIELVDGSGALVTKVESVNGGNGVDLAGRFQAPAPELIIVP